MARWIAVRYGWGFLKLGAAGTDTLPNMMDDYESEIDRLTAQLAEAKTYHFYYRKGNDMTDERKNQLMASVGLPDSHSIKSLIEQVENETAQQIHSDGYLQKVNTQMLVNDLRVAIDRALIDKMQFATVVGVLQFLIFEMIETAQNQEA